MCCWFWLKKNDIFYFQQTVLHYSDNSRSIFTLNQLVKAFPCGKPTRIDSLRQKVLSLRVIGDTNRSGFAAPTLNKRLASWTLTWSRHDSWDVACSSNKTRAVWRFYYIAAVTYYSSHAQQHCQQVDTCKSKAPQWFHSVSITWRSFHSDLRTPK